MDPTKEKNKCRLCFDNDEKINHIVTECSKSAQKVSKDEPWLGGEGDPLGIVQEV